MTLPPSPFAQGANTVSTSGTAPSPMSQPNRLIAYSAAATLRELGYVWDEITKAWVSKRDTEAAVLRIMEAADFYATYRRYSDKSMEARAELERVVMEELK